MKKVLFGLVFMAGTCYAGSVYEEPINASGLAGCVSISSTSWTIVPATTSANPFYTPTKQRNGIILTVVSTATASMALDVSGSTTAISTTIQPVLIDAGETQYWGIGSSIIMYLRSLGSAAFETVCYREIKQ